jgi:hypothetical protein
LPASSALAALLSPIDEQHAITIAMIKRNVLILFITLDFAHGKGSPI